MVMRRTGPPTHPLTFSLCAAAWGAYQNDGGEWTRVSSATTHATDGLTHRIASRLGEHGM